MCFNLNLQHTILDPREEEQPHVSAGPQSISSSKTNSESAPESIEDDSSNFPPHDVLHADDPNLDIMLEDLQNAVRHQVYDELVDDICEPAETLSAKIAEVTCNEVSEAESTHNADDFCNQSLFKGSSKKLGVVILLLCCFMVRFRLADEAMNYLLALVGLLLPDGNLFPSSLYRLRKYLKFYTFLPKITYYCSNCYSHVLKDASKCPNHFCNKDLSVSGAVSYFLQHSLINQLTILFKRKSFTDDIRNHRFTHIASTKTGHIRDVYDGVLYQNLYNDGFLKSPNNISFAMNTDGVSIFKSSRVSMWPVYLLINELPIKRRKERKILFFMAFGFPPKSLLCGVF